jgi:uroporphyrin-III C-methyltransferase/precorrin-2 dehydrogenase/sirohydrochlorin ferrochelatase
MRHFPIFLNVDEKPVILIGNDETAINKLRLLLKTSATIFVYAPTPTPALQTLLKTPAPRGATIIHQAHYPQQADFAGARMAIVAIEDPKEATYFADMAKAAAVPVNVVDQPESCDFITPAIVDRDPIMVAITSEGESPVLAQKVRASLEQFLPGKLGALARFAGAFRSNVAATLPAGKARRVFWRRLLNGSVAEAVLQGNEADARQDALKLLNGAAAAVPSAGHIFLVGAGPGDPELLTLKAHKALQQADIIIHDQLVSPEILDLARRDAQRIDVGKRKNNHTMPQDQINQLIIAHAQRGDTVVRLKGGDPFIFGRGGEELDAIKAAGLHATVVPGITAAAGCAASAGIPLTHRAHAPAFTVITGHRKPGELIQTDRWAALAKSGQTLVIYMGLTKAHVIADDLIALGLPAATPAAIIQNGTRPNQRVSSGDLKSLAARASALPQNEPAILIIGSVAGLADANAPKPITPYAHLNGITPSIFAVP